MFVVRPCSTKAAFEGVPNRQMKLNLNECSKKLEEQGYELIAVTDYIIVVRKKYEITLFPSGKILVKDVDNIESAKAVIGQVRKDLGLHEN